MNRIERLSNMLEGQKDKYLNVIVNYLMLQTEMDESFLKEEKNLKDMATYIKDLARKQATNNVAVIEDEIVFQWAKDYFIKSNKELGIVKTRIERGKHGDAIKVPIEEDEFGSIFGIKAVEKVEKKKDIEQISLF